MSQLSFRVMWVLWLGVSLTGSHLPAAEPTGSPEQTEFFEKKIRPILVEHCFRCHSTNGKEPKGGLRVDSRAALLTGGDTGPAITPGQPEKSLFIEAIRYKNVDLAMPPKGKLTTATITDLETWVQQGAPWPGATGKPAAPPPTLGGFDLQARKKEHWSWQPLAPQTPPTIADSTWPIDPVDRFILARLREQKLTPAPPADRLTWLRRVTFALIGLPPTPAEIAAFQKDTSPEACATVVDRLLASPHFGERWGRHWLDLVRYAESRGHEFDPNIANAWQYRDYVVRAHNQDVPYDAFVREHLAGDLLASPRLNPHDGCNESLLGTGFWHLGEEVHSPVDIRQDQADRLDNRIDVFSKAFLGLTVACARCHDHKFDAISTRDYYALYGLLEGSAYRQVRFDGWNENRAVARELAELRQETDRRYAERFPPRRPAPDPQLTAWQNRNLVVVDYSQLRPNEWLPDDVTFGDGPRPAGSLRIDQQKGKTTYTQEPRTAAVFDRFWAGLTRAPKSERTFGSLNRRDRAGFTLRTPSFRIEKKFLYILMRGGGMAYSAVCGHSVIAGPLHGGLVQVVPDSPQYRWVRLSQEAYRGLRTHLELTADPATPFAVALIVQADDPPPEVPPTEGETEEEQSQPIPAALSSLIQRVTATEQQLATRVRWQSRLAPALFDGNPVDEAVFIRGNPKTLGETVPHRGLEALFGPQPLASKPGSGRLELAEQLIDPVRNPYIARVAVNRIWHHLFGRGIVASVDNFGVLGEPPSHPALLDYLAQEFIKDGWSTKRLIRRLVLSQTYRMSSHGPSPEADPTNQLLHHFRVKRLEGEAIRDAILTANGQRDRTVGGPSIPIFLTPFLDGRGRPKSGPLDGASRRSLYLAVRRNFLSPFLIAFDTPIPFSTVGRRQVSNVPAQALILMNDPFVHEQTRIWATRILAEPGSTADRLNTVFLAACGRPARTDEIATCTAFLSGRDQDAAAWAELLHTIVNLKEFIFVR